ncbi:hypothetical protein [Reinekea thalattae]|uniref:Uncharacterized protein n=1 Tax=Reinekea thalattae TaxID=2593301 RepID=A0A5C8ZA37_9GAMM|nr:hypothetical protein [Reinekea thalattae]TXR53680.1 hypothetical protein FME95_03725 [Reinekea thalattae]
MIHRIVLLMLVVMAVSCTTPSFYAGQLVTNKTFNLAEGQEIALPVTVNGPIPAENETYKVRAAGFSVTASKESELIWGFAFAAKQPVTLTRVLVEQVAPGDVSKVMVEDNAASLNNGIWRANTSGVAINEDETPWLYEQGSTNFVFKITIQAEGEPDTVLYQPSIFSDKVKEFNRKLVASAGS